MAYEPRFPSPYAAPVPAPAPTAMPPGWYPDPQSPLQLRWYDGLTWTTHTAPLPLSSGQSNAQCWADPAAKSELRWIVPVGRNWQSIVAGYVALVAIFFWVTGPVPLGFGIWALSVCRRTGSQGRGRAIFAIIVGVTSTALALWSRLT